MAERAASARRGEARGGRRRVQGTWPDAAQKLQPPSSRTDETKHQINSLRFPRAFLHPHPYQTSHYKTTPTPRFSQPQPEPGDRARSRLLGTYPTLLVVAAVAAEERGAVVEQREDEEEHERDADGGAAHAVDGVGGPAEGEDVGQRRGAAVGGEDADEEEQAHGGGGAGPRAHIRAGGGNPKAARGEGLPGAGKEENTSALSSVGIGVASLG